MPPIPTITKYLMLACTAVFCVQLFVPLTAWFALFPMQSGNFLPWQLVSYAFLHGDLSHLLFNMLGLWMFGSELESLWGQRRYWQFLLISVITAALVQLLVTFLVGSRLPTVGASGALFGLLLAYALTFPRRQFDLVGFLPMLMIMAPSQTISILGMVLYFVLMTNRQAVPIPPILVPALVMVGIFGAIELLMGLFFRGGGVAHFAHLGGMLGGWLMIRYWRGQPPFSGGNNKRGPRRL
jgi:membrane associated rhomboid family serine protease